MDITAPAPTTGAAPGAQADATTISSDFDTFLRLLTAQISNQDPLDPMKAEEFAVQLATFSGVEQQVRTNELIAALSTRLGGSDLSQMADWVGSEVRARMPARFDGAPITIDPPMPVAGERHVLVVTDGTGAEIHRRSIDAAGAQIAWDGRRDGGGTAAPGLYTFHVESFEGGQLVATEQAETYSRVVEVRASRDGPELIFAGGVAIPATDATALRAPG